jgi:hypothetical protein
MYLLLCFRVWRFSWFLILRGCTSKIIENPPPLVFIFSPLVVLFSKELVSPQSEFPNSRYGFYKFSSISKENKREGKAFGAGHVVLPAGVLRALVAAPLPDPAVQTRFQDAAPHAQAGNTDATCRYDQASPFSAQSEVVAARPPARLASPPVRAAPAHVPSLRSLSLAPTLLLH